MTPFVLHVGLGKTGSSTLQRALFEHHSEVCFLGKWIGKKVPRQCCSYQVYRTLKPLIWQLEKSINIEKARTRYVEKILPLADGKNTLIASWEGLGISNSAAFNKRLMRVSDVCKNVKCVITFRNPLTWLPAMYLQNCRGQYLFNHRKIYRGRPYLDFEQWLQRFVLGTGSISNRLCHVNHVENAVAILGEENVGIFLFEQLKENQTGYYTSIAEFLEIGVHECLELIDGQHYNIRLSESQLESIREVGSSPGKRLRWRFSSRKKRSRDAGLDSRPESDYEVIATPELTSAWRERVCDATRAGHARLSERLNIDLGKYGYPV